MPKQKTKWIERKKLTLFVSYSRKKATPEEYEKRKALINPILSNHGTHPKIMIEVPEDLYNLVDGLWSEIEKYYDLKK